METFVKRYQALAYNDREIRRYMGVKSDDEKFDALISECKAQCDGAFEYLVCYSELPVSISGNDVDFGEFKVTSVNLKDNLGGVKNAILFVATVGFNIDRLIKKYSVISPVKSLCFSAIGSERAETLCNAFCKDVKTLYGQTKPRFSAGYGDLPLACQKDIFNTLNVSKLIGVTLNDSLLMTPSKSVSAFVGIEKTES